MAATIVQSIQITKVKNDHQQVQPDLVTGEEPLEIRVVHGAGEERKQVSLAVVMRSPGQDYELATGFLFTEGIITAFSQVKEIRYCSEPQRPEEVQNIVLVSLSEEVSLAEKSLQRHFYTTSSCGVCGKSSIEALEFSTCRSINRREGWISSQLIGDLPEKLREKQAVFKHTGGLHGCAVSTSEGELSYIREDVGRHNALDKLIGAMLTADASYQDSILILSGRVSFEMVQKAAMAGFPVIVAVGAPTSLAVKTAENQGICLIGFCKKTSFNIYTYPNTLIQ